MRAKKQLPVLQMPVEHNAQDCQILTDLTGRRKKSAYTENDLGINLTGSLKHLSVISASVLHTGKSDYTGTTSLTQRVSIDPDQELD